MAREGFVVYHELLEGLTPFSDAECGRLLKAMLKYSMTGEPEELSGNERFIWPTIAQRIDKDRDAYTARCETNRKNASERKRTQANDSDCSQLNKTKLNINQTKQEQNQTTGDIQEPSLDSSIGDRTENESVSAAAPLAPPEKAKKEPMHKHGEFGWVLLTDTQYSALLEKLGAEELGRCIVYIDQAAQSTGNKNRWKDWNLVIQRCAREGWGKRQNGGSGQKRTFADVYRDRQERGRQG